MLLFQTPVVIVLFTIFLLYYHIAFGYIVSLILKTLIKAKLFKVKRVLKDGDKILKVSAKLHTCRIASIRNAPFAGITSLSKDRQRTFLLDLSIKDIQFKCILTALIQDGNNPDSQKEANVSLAVSIDLLRVNMLSLGLFLTMFRQLGKVVRIMRGEKENKDVLNRIPGVGSNESELSMLSDVPSIDEYNDENFGKSPLYFLKKLIGGFEMKGLIFVSSVKFPCSGFDEDDSEIKFSVTSSKIAAKMGSLQNEADTTLSIVMNGIKSRLKSTRSSQDEVKTPSDHSSLQVKHVQCLMTFKSSAEGQTLTSLQVQETKAGSGGIVEVAISSDQVKSLKNIFQDHLIQFIQLAESYKAKKETPSLSEHDSIHEEEEEEVTSISDSTEQIPNFVLQRVAIDLHVGLSFNYTKVEALHLGTELYVGITSHSGDRQTDKANVIVRANSVTLKRSSAGIDQENQESETVLSTNNFKLSINNNFTTNNEDKANILNKVMRIDIGDLLLHMDDAEETEKVVTSIIATQKAILFIVGTNKNGSGSSREQDKILKSAQRQESILIKCSSCNFKLSSFCQNKEQSSNRLPLGAVANTSNLQIDIHKSTAMDTLTVTSKETKCSLKFFPHSTLPTIEKCVSEIQTGNELLDGIDDLFPVEFIADVSSFALNLSNSKCESRISSSQDMKIEVSDAVLMETIYDHDFISPLRMNTVIKSDSIVQLSIEESKTIETVHQEIHVNTHCKNFQILWSPVLQWYIASVIRTVNDTIRFHLPMKQSKHVDNRKVSRLVVVKSNETVVKARATLGGSSVADIQTENILVKVESRQSDTWDKPDILFSSGHTFLNIDEMRSTVAEIDSIRYFNGVRRATNEEIAAYEEKRTSSIPLHEEIATGSCGTPILETVEISANNKVIIDFPPELHLGKVIEDINTTLRTMEDGLTKAGLSKIKTKRRRKYQLMDISLIIPVLDVHFLESVETPTEKENVLTVIKNGIPKKSPSFIDRWRFLIKGFATNIKRHTPPDITQGLIRDMDEDKSYKRMYGPMIQGGYFDIKFDRVINTLYPLNLVTPLGDIKKWGVKGFIFLAGLSPETENLIEPQQYCLPVKCHHNNSFSRNFSSKKCSCDYGMIMNSANIPVKIYYDVEVESDLVTSTYGDILMASIPGLLNIIGRLIPKPPIEDSRCGKNEIVGPNLDWWDNLRYQFHGGFRWNIKSMSFRWLLDTVPTYDWSILLTSKNFVLSQSTGVGSLGMDNVAISIPDSSYHMLDVLPPNAGYETFRRSLTQVRTGFVRRRHPLIYFPKFFTKMTFEWGVLNDDINDPSRHHSVYVFDDERLRASKNDKFEYFRSRGWSIDWDFSLDEYADRGSWIALRGDVIPWITHKSPPVSEPIDPDENTPDPLPYVNKININVNASKLNIAAWFDEKSDSSIDTSLEEWSEGLYLQIPKFAFTRTGEKGQCYHLFGNVFAALLEINNDFDDIVCESGFSGKQGSQMEWYQRHHDRSIFEINPTHSLGFFESLEISAKNIRSLDYLLEVPEIKILEQSLDDIRGITTKEDVSDTSAPWTVLVAGMKLLWTVDIRDSIISIVKDILFSINFMTVNLRGTPQLLDAHECSTDFDSQSESGENNVDNASNHEESDHAIEMFVEGTSSDVHVVPTTSGPDTTQKSYIKHLLHHHTDRSSSISSPRKQSFGDKRNVLEYSGLQYESSKSPIIPTFDLHLSNPQIQFHSEKTGGSVIIGIRGAYIEGKKFEKLLAKNEAFDKEDFRLETLLRRTEFLYTLDRMELFSVSNDVDVDVGLQWLHLSEDVSSDCPESKILARCWEFPPDYDVFSTRNFLLPKTGTAVSRIMDPSTFKTRQEFHRPPIDLTKEELEEVIDYNQILPLEIDRNNALDSLEFFIDELSFHLDSHQFRTTFDVIRNTMLEPMKPRKERYYQKNNDSNNEDEKKSSEQKFKEKLIAESKKRKAEALTPANEMQKLLKAPNKTSKKWKEAAREVASRLVAEFEDGDRKSKNDVSIRRIEYNLCKAKWKIAATEEASINDTEINFTDFKGVHNFSADGAVSSVISLEDMHVTSLRPSEEASSFDDRSVIIKTILGEELSPCQRCGENFDRNSNEVNSCSFHPGAYARRDGSLEWSCCGDANEDSTGCIARPHTGSETAMDVRFNAYPRVLEGLTLYEFIEVNVYPGATHKTLVQLTRSLTSSLMNYFLGDSNDVLSVSPDNLIDTEGSIVTSARQSDVIEHSLYTHSTPSDVIEERDSKYNADSRRYLLFGDTNSSQDTISAVSKTSKTEDKKNVQSKRDKGKKSEKSEIVFLQKWNIGDINIHLSVAGFHRIIDIYDLPLTVAPFQRAYKIGPINHIVKKYVAHLVKNLLASSMGILKAKFTGHRHGSSLDKAPALIEDANSESENHAKEERDEVDASAILLAPPTTAAKKKKKLRIFGRKK